MRNSLFFRYIIQVIVLKFTSEFNGFLKEACSLFSCLAWSKLFSACMRVLGQKADQRFEFRCVPFEVGVLGCY